ncbi:MAG: hypothetical protein QGF53_09790 [Alphaproteobacteria bacterium]|jgi:hypothetical protein|nr:hypothetical protein [Alphaproteobacteria bacterium]
MSDIAIFTDEDLWVLAGFGIAAILWPLAAAGWTWRKVGFGWGALCLAASIVLLYTLAMIVGLSDAYSAWPIIITWAIVPAATATACIAWAKRRK